MKVQIPQLPIGEIKLTNHPQFADAVHDMEAEAAMAVRAAYAAGRPLLVRGEPGTGKSQLARAVAQSWNRVLISKTVDTFSESRDLLYHYDDLARLGEAQALVAGQGDPEKRLAPQRFLSPGPLWWAFNWSSAQTQNDRCDYAQQNHHQPPHWQTQDGAVVLIDEIDKAEAELPNGLLETLGNGSFSVPHYPEIIRQSSNCQPPLIIITTNEERELPQAFMRRCWVLWLKLPEQQEPFVRLMQQRGVMHFGNAIKDKAIYRKAAEQLWCDRAIAEERSLAKPGQAEYMDLLRAISTLGETAKQQNALLEEVAAYVLEKAHHEA